MNKRNNCVAAVIGAVLMGGIQLANADADDTLLASWGQFRVDDGESQTVTRGGAIKGYRICMEDGAVAVPLKVTFDNQEVIIEPGECQLIQATRIKLASASKLHTGMTLIGSFDVDDNKHYRTSVSVPQAVRND